MDNIKTWTGLSMEESIRMTEDRDKRIKYVHGVANLVNRTLVLEYFCRFRCCHILSKFWSLGEDNTYRLEVIIRTLSE